MEDAKQVQVQVTVEHWPHPDDPEHNTDLRMIGLGIVPLVLVEGGMVDGTLQMKLILSRTSLGEAGGILRMMQEAIELEMKEQDNGA